MVKCTGQRVLMSCHLMIYRSPVVCRLGIHVYTQYVYTVCVCLC